MTSTHCNPRNHRTRMVYTHVDRGHKRRNEIPHIATLFKQSFNNVKVPQEWKSANVTPIFKKGSRSEYRSCNYRPISLTSVSCKLLQRIIRDALVTHMDDNNLFCKKQHGFRSGHSRITQLLECLEDWTHAKDNGIAQLTSFTCTFAAFHKVSHRHLLYKLNQYGIKGLVHKWIKSVLVCANQRVVINARSHCPKIDTRLTHDKGHVQIRI